MPLSVLITKCNGQADDTGMAAVYRAKAESLRAKLLRDEVPPRRAWQLRRCGRQFTEVSPGVMAGAHRARARAVRLAATAAVRERLVGERRWIRRGAEAQGRACSDRETYERVPGLVSVAATQPVERVWQDGPAAENNMLGSGEMPRRRSQRRSLANRMSLGGCRFRWAV